MSHAEVMGTVSDRLIGGMMFHSDHADMMRLIGMDGLHRLHEDGFGDDSKSLRRVRVACVEHLCMLPPTARQERTKTLEGMVGRDRSNIGQSEVQRLVRTSMQAWVEWESGTVECLRDAAEKLIGCASLWNLVRKLQRDTERELSKARDIAREMETCGYDMCHVLEMQDGLG